MLKFSTCFLNDEAGATAVEYGLIVTLIALVTVSAFGVLGGHVQGAFQTAADMFAGG